MFRRSVVDMAAVGDVSGIRDKINRGKDLNKQDKVSEDFYLMMRYGERDVFIKRQDEEGVSMMRYGVKDEIR